MSQKSTARLPGFANLALVAAYGFEEGRDATAEAFAYAWEHWERETGLPGALAALSRRQRLRLLAGAFDSCGNYSNSSEQPPKKDVPLVTIGLEFSVIVRLMMASRAGVATPL
jgi:hypothetical protein